MQQRQLPLTASTGAGPIDPGAVGLTQQEIQVRRAAFRSIRRGRAPDAWELAKATGLGVASVKTAVGSLVARGQAVQDAAGRVVGSAGLSLVSARHRLRLGEHELHTWCAVDAIGIPAALGADAVASTACRACGRPIQLRFQHGHAPDDPELRVWLPRQDCCSSVVDELCPDMNLFCNQEHLEQWRQRQGDPPGRVLSLQQTEQLGRTWWGELG